PAGRDPLPAPSGSKATTLFPADRDTYEMEMAFSRGLHTGWLRGVNNQELVHGRFGKKRGVYLGKVIDVKRDAVLVLLEAPLKAGDGVGFAAGKRRCGRRAGGGAEGCQRP